MSTPKQCVENGPWGKSPFVIGRRYRVRMDYQALRDTFVAGEELTYDSEAYSRYDGYIGYFFTQAGTTKLRSWDITEDENLADWKDLFEEV